jgi:hypothetical protein
VVPVGAVLAIPAIRLNSLYLALATLGFGLVLSDLFYGQPYMFGDVTAAVIIPRPDISWLDIGSDTGYFYLVLAITVLVSGLVVTLNRSRLGRLLSALASSPTGLAASGTAINITWVLVFCVAAFLAAIAGALNGGTAGVVSAGSYSPLVSVTLFAVVVITVGREPWYALLAAAGYTLIPLEWTSASVNNWLTFAFGAFAVVYVYTGERSGTPAFIRAPIDRVFRRHAPPSPAPGWYDQTPAGSCSPPGPSAGAARRPGPGSGSGAPASRCSCSMTSPCGQPPLPHDPGPGRPPPDNRSHGLGPATVRDRGHRVPSRRDAIDWSAPSRRSSRGSGRTSAPPRSRCRCLVQHHQVDAAGLQGGGQAE